MLDLLGMQLAVFQSILPRLKSPLIIIMDLEFALILLREMFSCSSDVSSFGCGL